MQEEPDNKNKIRHCSFTRRLAVMFYDGLLLFSVLFLATAIVMPLTGGKAIGGQNIIYTFYLLLIGYLYFVWQWTHGGQTLGMRCWKLQLQQTDQTSVNWKSASLRYCLALPSVLLLGAGIFWSLFDPNKQSFHGRYSKTRLTLIN